MAETFYIQCELDTKTKHKNEWWMWARLKEQQTQMIIGLWKKWLKWFSPTEDDGNFA